MTSVAKFRNIGARRRLLVVALYATLLMGGLLLGGLLIDLMDAFVHPGEEAHLRGIVATVILIYVVVAALPFVPAAEIALSLMVMVGPETAPLVYAATVLALVLAFLVGRTVPGGACATVFALLGLKKAQALVLEMSALEATARLQLLLAHAPPRMVPVLLRHRYLALAFALNLPGNSLIGGGGGIALSAGLSGLYPLPAYLATVAVAVAPVPFLIGLWPFMQQP